MFRNLLAAFLTVAAFTGVASNLKADFAVFSWSAAAKEWRLTQVFKDKAQAESSAATARKLGFTVTVVDRSVSPTPPATVTPTPKTVTPIPMETTPAPPKTVTTSPVVKPATSKNYVLQTSIKGSDKWRTIMEGPDLSRLQSQARDYQKGGFEVRILNKADVAPAPFKIDPVPQDIPLIGTWDMHINSGGVGKSFTMEITHLKGTTFTFRVPFHGQGQGEFDAVKGTVRFHHNSQAYTGNVRRSTSRGWYMGGFISTSDVAATDWSGTRK